MKTTSLFSCAMIFLLGTTALRAADLTNSVHRSCCQAIESCGKPLSEKSLYQLDNAWTNDSGQSVKLSSLKGRPQVVIMFFASCQYTCPLLVFHLKKLETTLPEETRAKVGFTLISFDPKRDTAEALKAYRAQHELSSANWTLLNGDPNSVQDLAAVLGVQFKEDAQGQFSHSNLITLLNADGEIAYQQAGLNPDNGELIRQIEKLEAR